MKPFAFVSLRQLIILKEFNLKKESLDFAISAVMLTLKYSNLSIEYANSHTQIYFQKIKNFTKICINW